MILKGNQRSGARQLATHLVRGKENEHIEIHGVRGFMSDTPDGAFQEMYAISQGTRCKQYMFSLSLSPPEDESVPVGAFEEALAIIEELLGLSGQPRIIVFHEKKGRRHAHCVWSRIKADTMTAINLPHYKLKLKSISKQLYLKHGWTLPLGLLDRKDRNPLNYTLDEWQQARRHKDDPKVIKAKFQHCWATSKTALVFLRKLEKKGYLLAQGDKRGFVAVDYRGEVYSLSRWIGATNKELKAKLGSLDELPSVAASKAIIAKRMNKTLDRYAIELSERLKQETAAVRNERNVMTEQHKAERQALREAQEKRRNVETRERSTRMPRGINALWELITGKYFALRKKNEKETERCLLRDRQEQQDLIDKQLKTRRDLRRSINLQRAYKQRVQESLAEDRLLGAELLSVVPVRPTRFNQCRTIGGSKALPV
ncbi:MAG: relaxase [Alphaproteobacteria bacterium]|nr:relaxase [Alphaproteobacteria bacterium]